MSTALMNTYGTRALTFVKGEGAWLIDDSGKRYMDAISGIAVCGLGHCHPAVTRATVEQAQTLVHTSNLYNIPAQQQLAEKLTAISGMDNVFFGNSGAEANEAAIKLARIYGNSRGIEQPQILVMEHSFHGRTMATLSATGNPKVQKGFYPLVEGFIRVAYDDVDAVKAHLSNPDVVAILVEPVQGEGGVHVPRADYLPQLRKLCDAQEWLLMLDEVQTGNGRTGKYFAYQHAGILPDVVTTAKGLGNGFPIGACLARGLAAELFQPGNHGSTYGGNPLGCATALAVVNTLVNDKIIERVAQLGEMLLQAFQDKLAGNSKVVNVRGHGLMLGIELDQDCPDLVARAAEQGLLINVTAGRVIRLLPPFILTDAEAAQLVDGVCGLIAELS